jgi:hypothetical protein
MLAPRASFDAGGAGPRPDDATHASPMHKASGSTGLMERLSRKKNKDIPHNFFTMSVFAKHLLRKRAPLCFVGSTLLFACKFIMHKDRRRFALRSTNMRNVTSNWSVAEFGDPAVRNALRMDKNEDEKGPPSFSSSPQ